MGMGIGGMDMGGPGGDPAFRKVDVDVETGKVSGLF